MDELISEIGTLDQASARWTLATLFQRLRHKMTDIQHEGALAILKRNIAMHQDWIVLNNTIEPLSDWAHDDPDLKKWLKQYLERHANDPRKSAASRAKKKLNSLYN